MKKTIALILLAVMLLSLGGCGKSSSTEPEEDATLPADEIHFSSKKEQALYDEACSLIEEGNYTRALDVLAGIPSYMAVQQKMLEIKRLMKIEESQFLWGEWLDVSKPGEHASMTFRDDSYSVDCKNFNTSDRSYRFEIDGNNIALYLNAEMVSQFEHSVIDGIPHLRTDDGPYDHRPFDFVPAEYYEEQKPIIIELTAENWSDYFEIKTYESVGYDRWGDETGRSSGYAFFLKDEYTDRYIAGNTSTAGFWLKTDIECEYITDNGRSYTEVYTDQEFSAAISDYRQYSDSASGNSTLFGHVVALIYFPGGRSPTQMTITDFSRVIAEGSIALRP